MMNPRKIISNTMSKDSEGKDSDVRAPVKIVDRPTFILKTREGESRAVSPSQRNGNKKDSDSQSCSSSKSSEHRNIISMCVEMTNCVKLVDENMQLCEGPLDFLYDQQDFLVVGCLGTQGVGKSTIMSLLASSEMSDLFSAQNLSHQESGSNCTRGIDFYVTKNRVIYLDTQPILSSSVIDYSASFEQKKGTSDFGNVETNLELQSLQFAAFLFSVCHVIIFTQDWFVDPNLMRFLQTAEMLKPASATSMDQDYVEYYPHIMFLHNKAELQDFIPNTLEMMKEFYNKVFANSRLQTHSGLDMSSHLTEGQLNLFLIPTIGPETEPTFHENEKQLIEKLRIKIHGVARNAMTPSTLTEKNWYHYASKVIEAVKKSHLSSEYGRLMP
ncbi:protein SMG9 [Belonocnema kinseyi]|uniref:protein SMG9 n=1 Tax=Belonocnema kinseyi TaxID=2817044 RepID=UPI00143DBCB3|nr:protein SMG9 [Belonocnema kinseyi]XP_033223439.1 protein SMG9 [Belonocnema kinseyi]XP_033223440.1 protein SMG9 [Belonocnema kinseyi]XP_033223441.1 protein SMG9 [Belonocnema kinseyi]XP_033223442.1 protein SMG9 [Belonocnema kinseyi]XP_033223443.1 protein SMG9 [Belonocnema kinseyi]XP_033223444.1 protein SMG9 [Belonocnema kinseyi]